MSAGIQELVDAIVSLELTAADLLANASSYFNVDSGGVTYTINGTSLTLGGIIDCPAGSVSDDGVCGRYIIHGTILTSYLIIKDCQTVSESGDDSLSLVLQTEYCLAYRIS